MSKVTELSTELHKLKILREKAIHWVDDCSLHLDSAVNNQSKNELKLQHAQVIDDIKNIEIEIKRLSERLYKNDAENQEIELPQVLLNLSKFFIPKDVREFALGDICEKFESDVGKSGERTAKLNLVKNVLSSICPFVWGFVRARFEKLVGRVEK